MRGKSVLISGGSGLVGTRLTEILLKKGYQVGHISRSKPSYAKATDDKIETIVWDLKNKTIDTEKVEKYDYLINLVGAGIADKKWTDQRKEVIIKSRTSSVDFLFDLMKDKKINFQSVVSASASGFYGFKTSDHIHLEDENPGSDFLAKTCVSWENAAHQIRSLNIPTSIVRIGIVLSTNGGALKELAKPVKMGVGSPLGDGKQYIPWIHIDDLCGIFIHAMENKLNDTFNAGADEQVDNATFTKTLASVLDKPYWAPNVPAFVMKIILGERAVMVLEGSRISNEKIKANGFKFKFSKLREALEELYDEEDFRH